MENEKLLSLLRSGKYREVYKTLKKKKLSEDSFKIVILSLMLDGKVEIKDVEKLKVDSKIAKVKDSIIKCLKNESASKGTGGYNGDEENLLTIFRAWLEASNERYEMCLKMLENVKTHSVEEDFIVAKLKMLVYYKHFNYDALLTEFNNWKETLTKWKNYIEMASIYLWMAELLVDDGKLEEARETINVGITYAKSEDKLLEKFREIEKKTIVDMKRCNNCGAYNSVREMDWCPVCGDKLSPYITSVKIKKSST
ncbi:MAG: hypothetical protein QXL15_00610 [Candidatus Korarchaeota archaeon]